MRSQYLPHCLGLSPYQPAQGWVQYCELSGPGGIAERPSPSPITPANFSLPGSYIASAQQSATQSDVFAVNKNDGALCVTWVVGEGTWTDGMAGRALPARITPVHLSDPGAVIAAAHQTPTQLDVFFPGLDRAVHVTWGG